ncbi:hypothetical protein RND81_06G094800 [Saponaria officinalis]|uniref:Zinc finger GRF-type domain-containing protein n=1 Tax=Saponaria officinalis TaxID=3572 RepID=A0AAW1K9P2_SAPOF
MAGASNSTQQYVLCKHKLGAVLRTIKKGKNIGQRFYGCPLWPLTKWVQLFLLENDTGYSLCNRRIEGGTSVDDVSEKKVAEEKILKLKMKNKILKKQVTELKNEAKLLKLAMFGLVCILLVFVVCTIFNVMSEQRNE